MISIPPEVLSRAPEEGARVVALRLLEEARAALARIDAGGDEEALHDFRVALRRLRSSMRAYLPSLQRRSTRLALRRSKEIGSRTNQARDLEVQIAWLEARRERLSAPGRRALNHLLDELKQRFSACGSATPEGVRPDFRTLDRDLSHALGEYSTVIRVDQSGPPHTFAAVSAELVQDHGGELRAKLARIGSVFDEEAAHRARIQAKRTRYLIEPFVRGLEGGKPLLRRLKELQDILGELNDLRVLVASLTSSLELATQMRTRAQLDAVLAQDEESLRELQRRPLETGLLAVAGLIAERRGELFETLEAEWLGDASADFFAALARFAAALRGFDPQPVEIERKYLLEGLPPICGSARSVLIDQGWLEGRQVRERLRRVRSGDGDRYLRTIKLGTGVKRAEFEEEIRASVFEQLWPLTAGCRVHKRRYLVPEGELTWEIDEFLDRDLTLAEVELPAVDTEVPLPDWLRPLLVREVTDEPEYTNLKLAK